MLIIGAGPVGLRLAMECILLGAEVMVTEKRTTFSRNNVLHLWPFTIEDLRQLGAKKFYGKFCAGAIDHVSKFLHKVFAVAEKKGASAHCSQHVLKLTGQEYGKSVTSSCMQAVKLQKFIQEHLEGVLLTFSS